MGKLNKKKLNLYSQYEDNYDDYVNGNGGFTGIDSGIYSSNVATEDALEALTASNADAIPQRSKAKQEESRKLSPYEIGNIIVKKERLICVENLLYVYADLLYKPVNQAVIIELVQKHLTDKQLGKLSMYDYRGLYEYMLTVMSVRFDDITTPHGRVQFENGRFDIVSRRRIPESPSDFIAYKIRASYYPDEKIHTPTFNKFIHDCSGGDVEIINLILAFIGYCLLPDQDGKCFFVIGTASNTGKSLLALLFEQLIGRELISSASLHFIGTQFGLAPLVGKVMNFSMDLSYGKLDGKSVSNVKMLTGGDRVTVNEKFLPSFSYRNYAKLVFASNASVVIDGFDDVFYNRMIVIPFLHSIPKCEQDIHLLDKLWVERDGIITKAMSAARKLIRNNYAFPYCRVSETMKNAWAQNNDDSIVSFIQQFCVIDGSERTYFNRMYRAYSNYCNKFDLKVETENCFSRTMRERFGCVHTRWSENGKPAQRGFLGVKLHTNIEEANI